MTWWCGHTHIKSYESVHAHICSNSSTGNLSQLNNHGCMKGCHYKYAHHSSVDICEMSNNCEMTLFKLTVVYLFSANYIVKK